MDGCHEAEGIQENAPDIVQRTLTGNSNMLLLLFALTLIRNHTGLALPVSLEQSSPSSCSDGPQYSRTVWDIVWSCLVTIFACVWAALHPDVPRRLKDGTMEETTAFATPNFTKVGILKGVG